jgi:hypothetical protein
LNFGTDAYYLQFTRTKDIKNYIKNLKLDWLGLQQCL